MVTISLCMIVKNEEAVLARCLDSAMPAVDELIIVDTGSSDQTKQIAFEYTNQVYDFEWADDFSAARNFSFSKASCDYILWLDADDILAPAELEKLQTLKETLEPEVDAVVMRYDLGFDANKRPVFWCWRERLLKRERGYRWEEPVHECIPLWGRVMQADIAITHAKTRREASDRNLNIYKAILARGGTLSARGLLYYARELKEHGEFEEAARCFRAFLDGGDGWEEDSVRACVELAQCYERTGPKKLIPETLVRSFTYAIPRGEACCMLGSYYRSKKRYREAMFWYELALSLKSQEGWGLQAPAYCTYIPAKALGECCESVGEHELAQKYKRLAKRCAPEQP